MAAARVQIEVLLSGSRPRPSTIFRWAEPSLDKWASGFQSWSVADEKLIYEKRDGIAFLTLNRPEVYNCMDGETYELITDAVYDYAADDSLLCAVISGAGGNFSSGGDLKWLRAERLAAKEAGRQWSYDFPSFRALDRLEKPLIAALDGYCIASGFNVAVYYSDIRVATDRVQMGSPAVRRGLNNAGNTGTYPTPLTWYVPLGNALYLRLLGKYANAEEALRMGLVNEVVPVDRLMPRAVELAEIIKKASPEMIREEKLFLRRYQEVPGSWYVRLHDLIRRGAVAAKEDVYFEGVNAFLEKRQPEW